MHACRSMRGSGSFAVRPYVGADDGVGREALGLPARPVPPTDPRVRILQIKKFEAAFDGTQNTRMAPRSGHVDIWTIKQMGPMGPMGNLLNRMLNRMRIRGLMQQGEQTEKDIMR
jgi:hypothetical protein